MTRPPDTDGKQVGLSEAQHTVPKEEPQNHIRQPSLKRRVPVSTVAILTFLMAAATGLGTLPFFFFEIEESWKGVCNGMACGVMLAASFDLISEGQARGGGHCVVIGILLGGLFIIVSQRILDSFGDVKLMDLKGASARRMIVLVAIMFLHSFGEGSGVGVSYAGPRGFQQGLLVTIAIAVHNIPEGMAVSMVLSSRGVRPGSAMLWSIFTSLPQPLVAVPAFLCAGLFTQFLPICMGFAAGCMIWIVFGEVLPEALQEGAVGSQVATSATVSVAVMEWVGTLLVGLEQPPQWNNLAPFFITLLFLLGPSLGGILVAIAKASLPLHAALLSGLAAGSVITLSLWQPFQLGLASKTPLLHLLVAFSAGTGLFLLLARWLRIGTLHGKKAHADRESFLPGQHGVHGQLQMQEMGGSEKGVAGLLLQLRPALGLSPVARATGAVIAALCCHALVEGLMLGMATAPKSSGLGMRMLLPVALHGLPRGAAAAATLLGTGSGTPGMAVGASVVAGLAGPAGAAIAMVAGLDHRGLNVWLSSTCGFLLPAATVGLLPRAVGLDRRRAVAGVLVGALSAATVFAASHAFCAGTVLCRSAPEALT